MMTIPARTLMSLSGAGSREKVGRHAVFKPLCFGTNHGVTDSVVVSMAGVIYLVAIGEPGRRCT
jgi:hypothetical protein